MTQDSGRQAVEALRLAADASPNDVELRRLLAERMARLGDSDGAIEAWKVAVSLAPGDAPLKIRLAEAYLAADRATTALVVVEDLLREGPAGERDRTLAASLHLLHARALLATNDLARAAEAYRLGYMLDASQADPQLAADIGLSGLLAVPEGLGPVAPVARTPAAAPRPSSSSPADRRAPDIEEVDGVSIERPRVTFADVGGMEDLKEQIRLRIIHPFAHPELYAAYGRAAGGGLLLYGPPGCGKTFLARATAGEIGASFVSVGIADVLEMWIGSSERNLHQIFAVARSHQPTVLFFDEADALAADRGSFQQGAGRSVINQFLAELDGADGSNEGVLVLAATNAPWHMDPAFRRPGRFDEVLFVPPPDPAARGQILASLLRDMPARDVDTARIAAATEGWSGADLKGLVDRAVEKKLTIAIREGIPQPLTTTDLLDVRRAIAPTTNEWFSTVRNYVLYANESGLYDPVRPYLDKR